MTEVLTGDPLHWNLPAPVRTAVTIGVFDGVHRGHRAVLDRLVAHARREGLVATALTFDPHPLEVVAPAEAPKLLTTLGQRIELLGEAGVGVVGVLAFDLVREMDSETFAAEVLARRVHARMVTVGADFRFGRYRLGDAATLEAVGKQEGYEVVVIDLLDQREAPISSTVIRRLLSEGRVEEAAELLGRHYELRGMVVEGDRRGRDLGFPTANLGVDDRLVVPADGVYAAWTALGPELHPSVVNIGVRPTFPGGGRTVETHILDFAAELYGHQLGIRFVARLRDERRFESVDALVAQLERDVKAGRRILAR